MESRLNGEPKMTSEICDWLQTLCVTQGQDAGENLRLMAWQYLFLNEVFVSDVETAALSVPRGAGKTALLAAVAAATIAGPLAVPRGECIIVASSFEQATIAFNHAGAYLRPYIERGGWRHTNSQNIARLENPENGCRLLAKGSDPRRVHGIAPTLVLADEPAQWPPNTRDAMLAALETSLGKQPSARMVAIGTQSSDSGHWFQNWLAGGADVFRTYAAAADDDWRDEEVWRQANPSLHRFPRLLRSYRREAKAAETSDSQLASFRALRLNQGVGDTVKSELLTAAQWRACESPSYDMLPEPRGPLVWGVDLGSGAAMSAVAAYWPASGRAEVLAAFPDEPPLLARGKGDGVDDLYCRMQERGELVQRGPRVVDIAGLLAEAADRFGKPAAIVTDRWRQSELQQSLSLAGLPFCELVFRGMGFKDGGEDVRQFRKAALSGRLHTAISLLMRYAIAGAVTISDPAGNAKLAKAKDHPMRRDGHRDDAVAALILAVAAGTRWRESADAAPTRASYTIVS